MPSSIHAFVRTLCVVALALVTVPGCDDLITEPNDGTPMGDQLVYQDLGGTVELRRAAPTSNGGFVFSGRNRNGGGSPVATAIGPSGQRLWTTDLELPGTGIGLATGDEGDTYLTGEIQGQTFVARLSPGGALRWLELGQGTAGMAVAALGDGGCVVLSRVGDAVGLERFNSLGQISWTRGLGPFTDPTAILLMDNGYLVACRQNGQPVLLLTDLNGITLWHFTYGNGRSGHFSSLQPLAGGFVAAGGALEQGVFNVTDSYVVLIDPNGAVQWDWTWEPIDSDETFYIHDLTVRSDGLLVAAGVHGNTSARAMAVVLPTDGEPGWYTGMAGVDRFSEALGARFLAGSLRLAGRGYASTSSTRESIFLYRTDDNPLATDE